MADKTRYSISREWIWYYVYPLLMDEFFVLCRNVVRNAKDSSGFLIPGPEMVSESLTISDIS